MTITVEPERACQCGSREYRLSDPARNVLRCVSCDTRHSRPGEPASIGRPVRAWEKVSPESDTKRAVHSGRLFGLPGWGL